MEEIKGYISKVIFYNQKNGYGIIALDCNNENITCTGTMIEVQVGENVSLKGKYIIDQKYGRQFKITELKAEPLVDRDSILRYLSSGAIKGIKEGLAQRIWDTFQEETLRIIDEEPERLAEIKGISLKKAQTIGENSASSRNIREVLLFLNKYEINNTLGMKIYDKYKENTYHIIQNNPYTLIQTIEGVSFKKAEEIAEKVGIMVDSQYRIQSAIIYLIQEVVRAGHSFIFHEELMEELSRLLHLDDDKVELELQNMVISKTIIGKTLDKNKVYYLQAVYQTEVSCARMIFELANPLYSEWEEESAISTEGLVDSIKELAKENGLVLESLQEYAILQSIVKPVTIITGGPGTGKTTIIKMIIQFFRNQQKDVMLAAPTGRAAKRMTEATGYEAKTIHRLLEATGNAEQGRGGVVFGRNEQYVLETDVIIIDEMSMVDIYLFTALLKAIPVGVKVIFVGDIDQLPSVGPGQVLKDMIGSGICEVIHLQKIYRQLDESGIVKNAHLVKEGNLLQVDKNVEDFIFYEELNMNNIKELIRRRMIYELKQDNPQEIQVLTPMRQGELGVVELNKYIQNEMNPKSPTKNQCERNGIIFREGDKVIQLKNNYQMEWTQFTENGIKVDEGLGVFNGDIGKVILVNSYTESLLVEFEEGHQVTYQKEQMEELYLAYAITIHKAQGSEYPIVIIPLLSVPYIMCYRNLLYTGITRAKNYLILLGSKQVVKNMIENRQLKNRNTSLGEFIVQFIEKNSLSE